MNELIKKLKNKYITKISDGLYLFENRDVIRLIERNDRCRDWDVSWTIGSTVPHPDRFTHNEPTLKAAIFECYRESIRVVN
jgi:isopentenyldiphosphate isomerase